MSSGSESDEDFVPGEPEKLSEEDSADEETDIQYEKEVITISKKRKIAATQKGKKKQKIKKCEPEMEDKVDTLEHKVDPEVEKKREDDLWAKFLEGTDTKPKSIHTSVTSEISKPVVTDNQSKSQIKEVRNGDDEKARERRIFEFAGETIVVENNVIKEKIGLNDSPATVSNPEGPSPRQRGGISNLLGQLNKKNKLSTLEKSKLDWETYKKDEGLEEEIQSVNKGKSGYLERRDFLERADHRQYEIERDLRLNRRSKR